MIQAIVRINKQDLHVHSRVFKDFAEAKEYLDRNRTYEFVGITNLKYEPIGDLTNLIRLKPFTCKECEGKEYFTRDNDKDTYSEICFNCLNEVVKNKE